MINRSFLHSSPADISAVLDALVPPVAPRRFPLALPGAPAQPAYTGRRQAIAALPAGTGRTTVLTRAPGTHAPTHADDVLTPIPLAAEKPARGRAAVPRMRQSDDFTVDLLGVWATRDREAPLPAVIWEELTAAHPDMFTVLGEIDPDGGQPARTR